MKDHGPGAERKTGKVKIFTDGGSRGNPGHGACAAVIFDEKGSLLLEEGRYLGHCTNNFAEYNGMILALSAARELGARSLEIFCDSELLVKQFNGQYRIKDPSLKTLMGEIKRGAGTFNSLTVAHIRREANSHADRIVNTILDAQAAGRLPAGADTPCGEHKLHQPKLF